MTPGVTYLQIGLILSVLTNIIMLVIIMAKGLL